MIIVVGTAAFDPAQADVIDRAFATMIAKTRAEEGCLLYSVGFELGVTGVLTIAERWATLDAMKAHSASDHMASFRSEAGRVLKSMSIAAFEAGEPLEL
jgi:quinol monooxygenase YgiN